MPQEITIEQVAQHPVAVMRDRAMRRELSLKIPSMCGQAWTFIKSRPDIKSNGHMIAIYWRMYPRPGEQGECEFQIEAGAQVDAGFVSDGLVVCSATPGGQVATAVHIGPYRKLAETHQAIHHWCKQNGHMMAGPNWELYDHPSPDESKLRTAVSYLLK